jgi:hypothetical protein
MLIQEDIISLIPIHSTHYFTAISENQVSSIFKGCNSLLYILRSFGVLGLSYHECVDLLHIYIPVFTIDDTFYRNANLLHAWNFTTTR